MQELVHKRDAILEDPELSTSEKNAQVSGNNFDNKSLHGESS